MGEKKDGKCFKKSNKQIKNNNNVLLFNKEKYIIIDNGEFSVKRHPVNTCVRSVPSVSAL